MSELAEKHCKPCEGGVAPYSRAQAEELAKQLSREWVLSKEGPYLRRELKFKDFYRTMSFVNALAHIANIEDHHPDLEVGYNYCRVQYTTHAIKGLSENDFICAAKIDAIPLS
ncbi:MAG TPA: 4a-hydroxytetrahydrobiopterin dehydratase [Steroidobacteraceae bacterium]|nr:4a-hydroxytetrahydrobiopterin dehydratase [Steroidobacteraceae bacterium]